jgi:4-amino-4-deoxy-L-arabinose transferase-like glycosyltransferase
VGSSLYFVDEGIYLDAARRLLAGEGFHTAYANFPGYPMLLAAIAWPWPESVSMVRGVQALLAGAGALLVFALARQIYDRSVAIVAVALYALDPLLVVSSSLLYPEAMAAVLLTAMLLAAWSALGRDQYGPSAFAGLAIGALAQFRPVALVLLPVVALWIGWAVASSWGRRLLHAAIVAVCCFALIIPWTLRNLRMHGGVVPAATRGLADGTVPTGQIAQQGLGGALVDRATQDPWGFASHVVHEFGHFWELYPTRLATDDPAHRASLHQGDPRLPLAATFHGWLRDWVSAITFGSELVLALIGVAFAWRRRPAPTMLLLGVVLAYSFGFALFVGKLRYRIVVLPCVAIFAGVGTVGLASAAGVLRMSRAPRA